jgi:IS30 family transposase
MADETSRRCLFVAIDRATRWVFISVFKVKTAANARRFLRDLERAYPIRIRTILTDRAIGPRDNGEGQGVHGSALWPA